MNEKAKIVTGRKTGVKLLNSVINDTALAIDYRAFHFLAEHKLKLSEAFRFWGNGLKVSSSLIEDLQNIANQYECLRLRVLKDTHKNVHINIFKNRDYLYKCLKNLEELENEESKILKEMLLNY